jgi:hypothetical protein
MSTPSVKSTPGGNGHPTSPGAAARGGAQQAPGGAGRSDPWALEVLAERNACNERALAELRAAHELLRRRYEAVVEELNAFHPSATRPRPA